MNIFLADHTDIEDLLIKNGAIDHKQGPGPIN